MAVQLLSFTPDPELLMAAAAHLCYRDVSAVELLDVLAPHDVGRLIDIIFESGHLSVAEHVSFTFAIDGVSRVLTHQLVRHRVGIAISQQSQRFTNVAAAGYVTPPTIEKDPDASAAYAAGVQQALALYELLQSKGVPNEDARYVLPQAIETRLVLTLNMRELIHIYSMDACLRSQAELRQLLARIRAAIRTVSPRLARELRIKCFRAGYCDETRMCIELKGRMPRKDEVIGSRQRLPSKYYERLEAELDSAL